MIAIPTRLPARHNRPPQTDACCLPPALARAREADVEQRDRDVAAIKEALAAANAAHAQTAALLKVSSCCETATTNKRA